ncbi:MAG: DAK2 domain-containing protein, partial [Candidatus Limnocylindria bacterium]
MVTECDGATLLRVFEAAAQRFERDVAEIDALNVYPLPDGDTGRNMYHTLRESLRAASGAGGGASEVAAAAAQGALLGARGNSGVILSQIVRGLKDAFTGRERIGPADLRRAFALARDHARAAVQQPAGGTMLSLCDELAEAIEAAPDEPAAMLRALVAGGVAGVERTMRANRLNDAAGVVDAGAYGVWVLLH